MARGAANGGAAICGGGPTARGASVRQATIRGVEATAAPPSSSRRAPSIRSGVDSGFACGHPVGGVDRPIGCSTSAFQPVALAAPKET